MVFHPFLYICVPLESEKYNSYRWGSKMIRYLYFPHRVLKARVATSCATKVVDCQNSAFMIDKAGRRSNKNSVEFYYVKFLPD